MFTLGFMYLLFYIIFMFILFCLVFINFPIQFLTQWSTSTFLVYISRYFKLKEVFFFTIFSLTGLPPVGLFFVKFNILSLLLYQSHIFVITSLFITLFLNMLYYAQIFNLKNFKKNSYNFLTDSIFLVWKQNNYSLHTNQSNFIFTLCFLIILGLLVSILSVILFSDLYLVFLI